MVLGVPDPRVAGPLGDLGELDAAREALGDRLVRADGGEVEDRERDGGGHRRRRYGSGTVGLPAWFQTRWRGNQTGTSIQT